MPLIQGVTDETEAKLAEGRRVYAKLVEHLPPSTAAKLAVELNGWSGRACMAEALSER